MTNDDAIPPVLAWGAATDPGRVRTGNEDAMVAEPMVFGVADGMGGHQAGEVASAIAATTLRERLRHGAASVDLMVAAVVEANAAIFQGAHTNPDQRGMGTTLTALAAMPGAVPARLVVANVGDSRTYLLRDGRLRRVTVDHSYVQELVSTGHISEAEARTHPRRNIVTRALGIEPTVKVDTTVQPLVKGDRYVLCSDGLVDEVEDNEITDLLLDHTDPQAAAEALVDAANAHGGRDNVTVVVVDVLEGDASPDPAELLLDVDLDDSWADAPDRLIDAEASGDDIDAAHSAHAAQAGHAAHAATSTGPVLAAAPGPPGPYTVPASAAGRGGRAGATTMELPITALAGAPRNRVALGRLLFAIVFGLIIMLAVVLFLVVRHNQDDPAPATTTTSTSSTSTTSTSVVRTTTSAPESSVSSSQPAVTGP